jgi:hypothetical protein
MILVLFMAVFMAVSSFAQEGPENVFAINIAYFIPRFQYDFDLGFGFWYERYIAEYFTIGANFDIRYIEYDSNTSALLISLKPNWRLYPFATATSGFFAYIGTGYALVLYKLYNTDFTGHIINLEPGVGYKFIIRETFMLEPRIGYDFRFIFMNLENKQYFANDMSKFDLKNITWGIVLGFGI